MVNKVLDFAFKERFCLVEVMLGCTTLGMVVTENYVVAGFVAGVGAFASGVILSIRYR